MAAERTYYTIDPEGKLTCMKCKVPLVKGKAKFMYLENGFPVEMPVCPKCGFVYVPEELALGKVLAVERALEQICDQCQDQVDRIITECAVICRQDYVLSVCGIYTECLVYQ